MLDNSTKTIPKGWKTYILKNEVQFLKGIGLSKNMVADNGRNKCVLYGELYTKYNESIKNVVSSTNSSEGTKSKAGDVLMPGSTTTKGIDLANAVAINEDNVLLGGDIIIIRDKNKIFNNYYFAHYLTHIRKKDIEKLTQGTTIIHLYPRSLENLEIILPPINEQDKIAEILSKVDEDIDRTEEIIKKTEKLKKGLMGELFAKGIGHKKFKKSDLGEIPEEWETATIMDSGIKLIDGDRGANYPKLKDFSKEGYCLFLNNKNIKNDRFVFNECNFIAKEKDEAMRKGKLERNDIILTSRGTVGNVAYYDSSVLYDHIRINSGMLIFRHGEKFDPLFLYKFMSGPFMKKRYKEMGSGSAQPQLPIGSLELIQIPLLPIKEQKQIAEIILSVDKKIEVNKQIKNKLIQLKKGLMNDLLSGAVRVYE